MPNLELFPPSATKPNWTDLPQDRFNSQWRRVATVQECNVSDLSGMLAAHYLHKRPAIVVLCLMMRVKSWPCGCVVFAEPPPETSQRYGGKTWELARLYLLDEIPTNGESWLIAQSVRWIKRHHPSTCSLVSYADPTVGHSGLIYLASNWRPDGRTDDQRLSPRCDYLNLATNQIYSRAANVPPLSSVVRIQRTSKLRFLLPLHKTRVPSPKPPPTQSRAD